MTRIRIPPSGPFDDAAGGGFQSGPLTPAVITLDEGSPGPTSVLVTLAAVADVSALQSVTVCGWADIDMSVDETGSPAASDGSLLLEVSWDGGVTFQAATSKLWKGGGAANPSTLLVPLFASSKVGAPPTGDVVLRLTFSGEPVGGDEAASITLTSELAAVFA
jgi:hypothetical protein